MEEVTEPEAEPHGENAGEVISNNNSLVEIGAGRLRESEREDRADQVEAKGVSNIRLHDTLPRTEAGTEVRLPHHIDPPMPTKKKPPDIISILMKSNDKK